MKKFLSLLLALTMMVSMLSVVTIAADTNPTITRAVAISDTMFEITTSEPITVSKSDGKAAFALFVEKNGTVENLTEKDGRFGGFIAPTDTKTTEFLWTINANGNATNAINSAIAAGHKVYFGLNGDATSGMIDVKRAVDDEGKGFTPNVRLKHDTHGIYGVEVQPYNPLTVQSVTVSGVSYLDIEFSRPVSYDNTVGVTVLFGVLNADGKSLYSDGDARTSLDATTALDFEVNDGKLRCWFGTNSKSGMPAKDGKDLYKIIDAIQAAYPEQSAGIQIVEKTGCVVNNMVLDPIRAEDGTPLQGMSYTGGANAGRSIVFAKINTVCDPATLLSAARINDNSMKITFNKEVTVAKDGGGFGIVAVDETGTVLFDATHSNMRYGGTMDKTSGTEFVWTIDASAKRSVTDIMLDWQAKGYTIMFCSNSSGSQNPAGYNSRVIDANGNPLLAPVAKQHSQTATLYYALCDIDNDTVTAAEIETAIAIDDFRFEIKFDRPVKVNNKGCMALMAFDKDGNMLFAQDETKGIAGGTLSEASGTDINDTWTWIINNGLGTASDMIKNWVAEGYTVKLSANGDSNNGQGTLVNNRVTDGTYSCLKANYYNTRTKQNCHTIAVSALDNSEDITIESVVYCGTSQILVTFSEPVEINAPSFIGLRIVDKKGNYITPIDETPGSQHNMVWNYVKGSNQTQIMLTFHSRHMHAMLNLSGLYEAYAKDGNHTVFMIGEKTTNERNGYIDDVVGLDGTGVLKATYAHLVYQELNMQDVVADTREPLTVVSATAISDTDIVIKFSAPVEIGYSPFICLRVVDPNNNQVFGESGTRLQYYGTWKFADDTKDTIIWTSNNWNVKGLLSLTGPWAKFNKDGNVTRLCIEELEDKNKEQIEVIGNGFIDNVTDAKGMMLTANLIAGDMNTYDGLYVDIVEDYQDPEFFLKSAAWTDDKKITLTFNKPVYFEEKPYMAIRFVNEANVLQYDNGQPLQYQGSWEYGNEEKTVLIWTATYGGSVTAIMNRTGKFANYPDYKIMFCIEEIPADKVKGDTEDGTIHNMYTDGGAKLYANVVGAGTNRDGVYMPIAVEYTPTAKKDTSSNPTFELPKPEVVDKVIPAAGGPMTDKVLMANHTEFTSMIPKIALGVAASVFVGIIAILVTLLPKKKDE